MQLHWSTISVLGLISAKQHLSYWSIESLWTQTCLYAGSKWTANRSHWPNIKGWRRRF